MRKLLTRLLDLLGLCPATQMDNKVRELDLANQEINRLEYELQTIKSKLLVLSKGPDTRKREFAGILVQSNEELSASSGTVYMSRRTDPIGKLRPNTAALGAVRWVSTAFRLCATHWCSARCCM